MTMCKWKDKSHKLCVDMCADGCWREKQSTFKPDQSDGRKEILKEYKRLVGEYQKFDYLFEQNEDTDDDDLFNYYWLAVTKAHMHMVDYRHKHNITRDELTESTQGIRCSSVQEVMEKVAELFDNKGGSNVK